MVGEGRKGAETHGGGRVEGTGERLPSRVGAGAVIGAGMGRTVVLCASKVPGFTRPDDSSAISLFTVAERLNKSDNNILKRVFNGGKK